MEDEINTLTRNPEPGMRQRIMGAWGILQATDNQMDKPLEYEMEARVMRM